MNKYVFKMMIALLIGLFVMGGTSAYGQLIDPGRTLELDDRVLYERGYNTTNPADPQTGPGQAEERDLVMVGATVPYFIVPDRIYNPEYYDNNDDWEATEKTESQFSWLVRGVNTLLPTFIRPNTIQYGGTESKSSPWVTFTWPNNVLGFQTIEVKEMPPELFGLACESSDVSEIPVTVINQPTLKLNGNNSDNSECAPNIGVGSEFWIEIPIEATTESSDIIAKYTMVFTPLGSNVDPDDIITTEGTVPVTFTSSEITELEGRDLIEIDEGLLKISVLKHGKYDITITSITDHVARKWDFDIPINTLNKFEFTVLPSPAKGRIFHVPNRFISN